jgi:hypothetical protein
LDVSSGRWGAVHVNSYWSPVQPVCCRTGPQFGGVGMQQSWLSSIDMQFPPMTSPGAQV